MIEIHQQTVENQTTNYNPMILHLRVVTHRTGIYRNILVCHFRITGSRQRVITRYKSLSGKRFDYRVMWDFPRLADVRLPVGGPSCRQPISSSKLSTLKSSSHECPRRRSLEKNYAGPCRLPAELLPLGYRSRAGDPTQCSLDSIEGILREPSEVLSPCVYAMTLNPAVSPYAARSRMECGTRRSGASLASKSLQKHEWGWA